MLRKGFTLIELLIVLAIIGILASLAIPMYQDYTIRTQVSEGLTLAAGAKTAASTFFAERGEWPATPAAAGYQPITGRYVSAITIAQGGGGVQIEVRYNNNATNAQLRQQTVTLTGTQPAGQGQILWACTSSITNPSWLPQACRP